MRPPHESSRLSGGFADSPISYETQQFSLAEIVLWLEYVYGSARFRSCVHAIEQDQRISRVIPLYKAAFPAPELIILRRDSESCCDL